MKKTNRAVLLTMLCVGIYCGREPAHTQPTKQYTEREVTIQSGGVQLRGTTIVPVGKGRHPGVVFLHGSGPATRAGARAYAEEFARLGVASLIFDKRGSGESGGAWTSASLDDLSRDALAAVAHLKGQSDIDGQHVGLWAISQGAWVATLAASESSDIAFMILVSGGGATPRESELFSYEQAYVQAGFTQDEKTQSRKIVDAYFRYLATGEARAELVGQIDAVKGGRLAPLAEQLAQILPSEVNRPNWSWVATWDPAAHIAKITVPVLLMFGDQDTDHPTELAVRKWRQGLQQAQNSRATIMVFPGAGHGIRVRGAKPGTRAPFADGYREAMAGWLWRHIVDRAD